MPGGSCCCPRPPPPLRCDVGLRLREALGLDGDNGRACVIGDGLERGLAFRRPRRSAPARAWPASHARLRPAEMGEIETRREDETAEKSDHDCRTKACTVNTEWT